MFGFRKKNKAGKVGSDTGMVALIIGPEQIAKATETLRKYKAGKENLERRVIENEEWWKMRHWRKVEGKDLEAASGWLVNVILSKHADAMDAYPIANMLPREEGDKEEAKMLSSIIPVVMDINQYERTYSDIWWYKLKTGCGVSGVFWDPTKQNGLGDITIRKVDLLNLFWQPGITDIQASRNVFHAELIDNELLEQMYPQLENKLAGPNPTIAKYLYDDNVDTSDKSVVIDWYYKKKTPDGQTILHYVKYVNENVLYATENETAPPTKQEMTVDEAGNPVIQEIPIGQPMSETGLYDHAQYPFVFDALFPEEGTPSGYGYIDLCKEAQKQIDLMNAAITKNALVAAVPRWFIRNDGAINEEEYADFTLPFVHCTGNLGEDSIRSIEVDPLPPVCLNILDSKINELKETSGNRDVNNGGTTGGATAASAIAAMQEQSGKLSRDMIKSAYFAYSQVVYLCVELIRQFYDVPRKFRILGDKGQEEFVSYSNRGIRPQPQGQAFGIDLGHREPIFDIDVAPQKENPYSKMSQNELALQLYNAGFFNPQMTDQALATLDIMDFNGREEIMQTIEQNGTLFTENIMLKQQLLQVFQIADRAMGTNLAEQFAAEVLNTPTPGANTKMAETDSQGSLRPVEHPFVKKSRQEAQAATQPR